MTVPTSDAAVHIPILTETILEHLELPSGATCIDATVNGGGHTGAMLEATVPDGRVLGIDRDAGVLALTAQRHAQRLAEGRLVLAHGNFRDLSELAASHGFLDVDAVLFDVGVSSYHFDRSGRGFRFAEDEPLDMRFDTEDASIPTAADLLRELPQRELTRIFREYGEERFAAKIAWRVVQAREDAAIETTSQLVAIIERSLPANVRWRYARSAARIFQALRIAVNDELSAIAVALPQAFELLRPGGRLATLAFHSLEDRIIKRYFVEHKRDRTGRILTKRPLQAGEAEVDANSRAASAKLRVLEKL